MSLRAAQYVWMKKYGVSEMTRNGKIAPMGPVYRVWWTKLSGYGNSRIQGDSVRCFLTEGLLVFHLKFDMIPSAAHGTDE